MSTASSRSWPTRVWARQPEPERSMRELDPLGVIASRPLTLAAAYATPVFAVTMTVLRWGELDRPWLMMVALVALTAACCLLVRAANTSGASFSARNHVLVVTLGCSATLLAALSQWHGNQFMRDDWGQLMLGILLVATSPYRPIRQLVLAGAAGGAFVAVLALAQSTHLVTPMAPTAFAVVAAVPVLALSLAGAAWAHSAVQTRERRLASASVSVDRDFGEPSVPLGEQERVSLLSGDVAPFLQGILDRGIVEPQDAAAARHIASAVRSIMVAEAKESWLGRVVADLAVRARSAGAFRALRVDAVNDPARLSDTMDFRQHTAMRALLNTILLHPAVDARSFTADVELRPGGCKEVRLVVSFEPPRGARGRRFSAVRGALRRVRLRRSVRRSLGPYLAVTRRVFGWQSVVENSSNLSLNLTLRFSYGH